MTVEIEKRNERKLGNKEYFLVKVTFREPFEYFFEIAEHHARFESHWDAEKLAKRIREVIKNNGWKSVSFSLKPEHWNYVSSAYTARMERSNELVIIPRSIDALHKEMRYD